VVTMKTNSEILNELSDVDKRIENNRVRLRDAVIRMTSMGRLSESYMVSNFSSRSHSLAFDMLKAYRSILMEEYDIKESDLISIEKTIEMIKLGEL
jgi:hypothetical protein